jgi:hypothetical protein
MDGPSKSAASAADFGSIAKTVLFVMRRRSNAGRISIDPLKRWSRKAFAAMLRAAKERLKISISHKA